MGVVKIHNYPDATRVRSYNRSIAVISDSEDGYTIQMARIKHQKEPEITCSSDEYRGKVVVTTLRIDREGLKHLGVAIQKELDKYNIKNKA